MTFGKGIGFSISVCVAKKRASNVKVHTFYDI